MLDQQQLTRTAQGGQPTDRQPDERLRHHVVVRDTPDAHSAAPTTARAGRRTIRGAFGCRADPGILASRSATPTQSKPVTCFPGRP